MADSDNVLPISAVEFDPQNARVRTERSSYMIKESLQKFGPLRSLVGQRLPDGRIIVRAGNGTLEEAGQIGIDKVRIIERRADELVVVVADDLEENDWKSYAIADNRASDLSDWNVDALAELGEDIDLTPWFTAAEIEGWGEEGGGDWDEPSDEQDEANTEDLIDQAEQGGIESRVKPGEIWALGRHRIACGDSTDEGNVRKLLGGRFGEVGMVWADPPFGIDLKPQRGLTKAIANDRQWEAKDLWAAFIPVLFDAMRDDTIAFLCQDWSEFDWTLPIVRSRFTVKSKIVWHKNQWGIGYYLRPQHEDILYCWKGQPAKPDTAISDVWSMARLNAPEHSCEKPTDLPMKAMEFASLPSDTIFDPFLGVAPSIIAAQKMPGDRTVFGFELSPDYCEVICRRWEQFTGGVAELAGHL